MQVVFTLGELSDTQAERAYQLMGSKGAAYTPEMELNKYFRAHNLASK